MAPKAVSKDLEEPAAQYSRGRAAPAFEATTRPMAGKPAPGSSHPTFLHFVCTGLSAWLVLSAFRGEIIDPPAATADYARSFLVGLAASFYDLIFMVSVTIVALLAIALLHSSRVARLLAAAAFYGTITFALACGFANIHLVRVLGEPFTFQWLVYGDFLQNADARNAISDGFNWREFSGLAVAVVLVFALGFSAARLWLRFRSGSDRVFSGAVALCASLAVLVSGYHLHASTLPLSKLQNPIVYFTLSALFHPTPIVLTMPASPNDIDVASVGERPPEKSTLLVPKPNPIKNVLLFIMESVPAKYLEPYGGQYPVTPHIGEHVADAVRFTNIYAHAPSTNYTMFSLLSSVYNDVSYYGMTNTNPYLRLDSFSNILSRKGFRTGFFWSADSRFQRMDEFLMNKGFDVIEDFRGQTCNLPTYHLSTEDWKNADYNNDLCTAEQALAWINSDPQKPFFAVVFTAMTHYPYQVTLTAANPTKSPDERAMELVHYSDDEKFNSYLNALRIGDLALGDVLEGLKRAGKLDSTLVVVMGDHGEAFGEHGTYSHASALYEENVHVPLIMINPHLFNGQLNDKVGGVIDIAPTIFDILNIKLPDEWQGRSLFSTDRSNKVFFFAPWRGVQFGYREDDRKVIFNANTGKIEVYDLKTDPRESHDLFVEGVSDATALLHPIAGWVQSQKRRIARLTAKDANAPPSCSVISLEIDAGGTEYVVPPRMAVYIDGQKITEVEVPGVESHAATAPQSAAEMTRAAGALRPFEISLPAGARPETIEIRFVNDGWGTPENPGDRNLFIGSVKVNGVAIPKSRLSTDPAAHGLTGDDGTAIYQNGSLWVRGPFGDCYQ